MNRLCDRPRIIESLRGKEIVDVTCGGAHSAAITASGELYTWGKGRYGRLGHGDSDDQLKPKLVEALIGSHVTISNLSNTLILINYILLTQAFVSSMWLVDLAMPRPCV